MQPNEYLRIFLKIYINMGIKISLKWHYDSANSKCGIHAVEATVFLHI
jgi:hypothetical protein